MTPEQVTLLAQMLTLAGVGISIGWGVLQHHWANVDRLQVAAKLEADRKADAAQLESDRVLLAAELEHQREKTSSALEDALEKRADEIRAALDKRSAEITAQQDALTESLGRLHGELQDNTDLTKHAGDRAEAAYQEAGVALVVANSTNEKIVRIAESAQLETRTTALSIQDTGADTNRRIQNVEAALNDDEAATKSKSKNRKAGQETT